MSKFLISLQRLNDWFFTQKRVLPWRNEPTLYRVWISEIMLQQTQVITVIPYFESFIQHFPTVEALAQAEESEVLQAWAGLGYYSRARNLHRGAKIIVAQGRFPADREEWLEIPGVGDYTAGAILSIAKNEPEPILDGNIERVLSRVRRIFRQKSDSAYKKRLWRLSAIFVQKGVENHIQPRDLNQALMELGATLCLPKNPQCERCPLLEICRAHQQGDVIQFPPKKKAKEWVQVEEKLHGIIFNNNWVLLRRRQMGEWRAGLWDLVDIHPGKILPLKNSAQIKPHGKIETQHVVTRHKIKRTTQLWLLAGDSIKTSTFQCSESTPSLEIRWVSINKPDVPLGSALRRTLKKALEVLPKN